MLQGKIIFFNQKSKFGFIKGADGTEYYVHAKHMTDALSQDDVVEFELKIAKRGPEAVNVRKIVEDL